MAGGAANRNAHTKPAKPALNLISLLTPEAEVTVLPLYKNGWVVRADAGDPSRCHGWHDSLRDKRPLRWTNRVGSALGFDPGMDG